MPTHSISPGTGRTLTRLLALGIILASGQTFAQTPDIPDTVQLSVLDPGDAVVMTWRDAGQVEERTSDTQKEIAGRYMSVTRMDPEDSIQKLALAELHFLSFQPVEARALYADLKNDPDPVISRHAWRRSLRMTFAAFNEFDVTASQIAEYRARFPADVTDYFGLYQPVRDLAAYHRDNDRADEAMALILDETKDADRLVKQASARLLSDFKDLFIEQGHRDRLIRLAEHVNENIPAEIQSWREKAAHDSAQGQSVCTGTDWDWYWTMNNVRRGETLADTRIRNLERSAELVSDLLETLQAAQ